MPHGAPPDEESSARLSAIAVHLKISKADDASHLEKALEAVPGVHSIEIDPADNEARVQHDGIDPQMFTQALREQGYISEFP